RLARKLCPHCKQPQKLSAEDLLREGFSADEVKAGVQIFDAVGCDQCVEGYRGRTGIYQVMPISETLRRIILTEGSNAEQIADQASKEGILDLRQAGLHKVKAGITSLKELNRVTVE
ncbi:MAG: type IV-A pilus assembly ATPase PilB, partial [Gammaproteobacteria bacterium]|nr:type IV-A pilus assembly ATPase PilB [Gammaproteobacteria bacterium]